MSDADTAPPMESTFGAARRARGVMLSDMFEWAECTANAGRDKTQSHAGRRNDALLTVH
jgi:hypothetical protein